MKDGTPEATEGKGSAPAVPSIELLGGGRDTLAGLNEQALSSEANASRELPLELIIRLEATNGTALLSGVEEIARLLKAFTLPKKGQSIKGKFFCVTVLSA